MFLNTPTLPLALRAPQNLFPRSLNLFNLFIRFYRLHILRVFFVFFGRRLIKTSSVRQRFGVSDKIKLSCLTLLYSSVAVNRQGNQGDWCSTRVLPGKVNMSRKASHIASTARFTKLGEITQRSALILMRQIGRRQAYTNSPGV